MKRDIDPVEARLLEWSAWMQKKDEAQGFPSESPCFIPSWIKDREELFDNNECEQVAATAACVDSLANEHRRIIYYMHGLGYSMWGFKQPIADYDAALKALKPLLQKRCLL